MSSNSTIRNNPIVRLRADLKIVQQRTGVAPRWIVKDPVTLKYYYFAKKEMYIMRLLDGQHSLEEIKTEYEKHFAPHKISYKEIEGFCHSLHTKGLAIAKAAAQGDVLLKRSHKQRLLKSLTAPLNLLAIRLPGVDPERFLTATFSLVGWLFHPFMVTLVLLNAFCLLALGALHANEVSSKLPTARELFQGENLFWMMLVLGVIKIFHELGHAYACKRFGGECHEIGVMLLAFMPCMYCNVSDAWMLPERRKRIFISAAGIYIELILASVCSLLWYFSQPGLLNSLCMNVMFVCSVGTILINANPLMRYDGYYIFADWVNVPNLSQQAKEALMQPIKNWFLNKTPRQLPLDANVWFLRLFCVASLVYRVFVISLILWFAYDYLERHDMRMLADLILVATLGGLLLQPIIRTVHWWRTPMNVRTIRTRRVILASLVAVSLFAGIASIPLSTRVRAHALSEFADEHRISIPIEGQLVSSVRSGKLVQKGDTLATLENLELKAELIVLEGKLNSAKRELENLRLLSNNNPAVSTSIPTATSTVQDFQNQYDHLRQDIERLTIVATSDGVVFPPQISLSKESQQTLPQWTGTPLDVENTDCFLERSTHFCSIAQPHSLQTRLLITQDDVELIKIGDQVEIMLDGLSLQTLKGSIIEISHDQLKEAPRNLALGADLAITQNEQGKTVPLEPCYQAIVQFDTVPDNLLPGSRGRAVITGRTQTIGQRVLRFLNLNFRFAS
ncbi:MAG: hypothetical protein COA78_08465 [Blastopirellula sp.]|nr:MAG: hypothetical protein COA78_08465 [Blastopirellula sp.]